MTKLMLINATSLDELRVAVVQDGELVDLDIESEQSNVRGNIYKGVVHNVEGSLAAAFIDFGQHKQGFLPFDEIAPSQYFREWKNKEPPRIPDVFKRGQDVIVQVSKDAVGEKGAALTTYLSLAGRFTVLMPGSDARGVSRKIEDETERKKIKAIAEKVEVPEGCGYIIRTAGLGQGRPAIQKDLDRLSAIREGINRSAQIARAPSLLHAEADVIGRTLRDLFNEDIDEVWIDSREEYDRARAYFEELMPDMAERIKFWQNPIPIFAYHDVESQIEATFSRRVSLPSGGSIVIDQTEALVTIDVNSGKTSERDHEDTVYKTNFEAAQVAAHQLRLRDLGGIVVIDFIDMELERNSRAVVKALKDAFKCDKARIKVSRITSNGLCILTRQRIRQGIQKTFQRRCPACDGTGWIRTGESHSLSILRRIETRLAQGSVGEVRVKTHRETATHILNYKRAELLALEREFKCRVVITARSDMDRDKDDVSFVSMGQVLAEITDRLPNRDELRQRREAQARKRTRKKSGRQEAEAAAISMPAEELGTEASTKKRRRKKRGEADVRHEAGSARVERDAGATRVERDAGSARVERDAGATRVDRDAGSARVDRDAGAARVEAIAETAERARAEPGVPGGPTFTGRPTPEMLARIKAERAARLLARENRRSKSPSDSNSPSEGPQTHDTADFAGEPIAVVVSTPVADLDPTVGGGEAPERSRLRETTGEVERERAPRPGLLSRLLGRRNDPVEANDGGPEMAADAGGRRRSVHDEDA